MRRTIVLTGAPEQAKLDWNEKSLMSSELPVEITPDSPPALNSISSKGFTAQWRELNTNNLKMTPVLPPLRLDCAPSDDGAITSFFTPLDFVMPESPGSDISESESQPSGGSADTVSEALSEYYDHSFTIHQAVPASRAGSNNCTPGTPTYDSGDEIFPSTPDSGMGGGIMRTPSQRTVNQAPRPKHLSDLEDIPNSDYLSSIQPQTMTVNLIVGILSIAPPRKVTTGARYGKPRKAELVELTVGDETKSNFCITMWLPREMHVNWKDGANATPEGSRSALRRNLKFLRPRDVIMIQNVALSSFRGKVHGQSLRGDVTKVDLLFRRKVDDDDLSGVYSISNLRTASSKDPQVLKVKRVRDWLVNSIGEAPGKGRRRLDRGNEYRGSRRMLPADTQ